MIIAGDLPSPLRGTIETPDRRPLTFDPQSGRAMYGEASQFSVVSFESPPPDRREEGLKGGRV